MEDRKRRDRVAKACALCRHKKIKCDGSRPCAHCVHVGSDCVYQPSKQRKPRLKGNSDFYAKRIDKLESLIFKIVEKIDGKGSTKPEPLSLTSATSIAQGLSEEMHQNGSVEKDSLLEHEDDLDMSSPLLKTASDLAGPEKTASYKDLFFQECKSILHETLGTPVESLARKVQVLHYMGTHMGVDMVFSDQSIKWIRSKLREEDLHIATPLETLIYYFGSWKLVFLRVWAEPQVLTKEDIRKLRHGVFQDNGHVVFELLEMYETVHTASFLCDFNTILDLFQTYYSNKGCPSRRRELLYSELFLMKIAVALCLSVVIDHRTSPRAPNLGFNQPHLDKLSVDQLVSLQEETFMNAVFYFHRISVVGEGIVTIQALMLMVLYLETSWVTSEVSYTFSSMAVRYAQELGLHRFETFQHLPTKEKARRTHLWAACEYLDVEIAYRMGRPPLVNNLDVSTLTKMDPQTISDGLSQQELLTALARESVKVEGLNKLHFYHNFYLYKLSQIRSYSYFKLFSATVKYDSLKSIQEIVTSLNTALFDLSNSIEEKLRPRFFYEPEFEQCLQYFSLEFGVHSGHESLMLLHLTFFHHIMAINRIPWQVVADEADTPPKENAEFRRLCLDSARTILHIVRAIDRNSAPFVTINWLISFPFVATMNLLANCLNHADDPECFKDLSLLIDVSMNFFGHYSPLTDQLSTRLYYLRLHIADLVVRVFMRITVKVVEEHSNMNILNSNPALREHLECVERKHPQFYTKIKNQAKTLFSGGSYRGGNSNGSSATDYAKRNFSRRPTNSTVSASSSVTAGTSQPAPRLPGASLTPGSHDNIDFSDFNNQNWFLDEALLNFEPNGEFTNLPNFFFDNGL